MSQPREKIGFLAHTLSAGYGGRALSGRASPSVSASADHSRASPLCMCAVRQLTVGRAAFQVAVVVASNVCGTPVSVCANLTTVLAPYAYCARRRLFAYSAEFIIFLCVSCSRSTTINVLPDIQYTITASHTRTALHTVAANSKNRTTQTAALTHACTFRTKKRVDNVMRADSS